MREQVGLVVQMDDKIKHDFRYLNMSVYALSVKYKQTVEYVTNVCRGVERWIPHEDLPRQES